MTKYDERFKLDVVQRYLSGDKGCKALAREFGVGSTQVEQWVASYKRHGADGLRRKGHVKYSAQFKLEALERMQRGNPSRTHMQALLDIRDAGAIARWERQYHEGGFAALLPRPKGRRPKMSTSPLSEPAPPESEPDTRNCLDNAAMEGFFGTLKAEFFHLTEFDSVEQLQAGIRQYIRYYNHERIRLKLKGLSPVQYRTQPLLA